MSQPRRRERRPPPTAPQGSASHAPSTQPSSTPAQVLAQPPAPGAPEGGHGQALHLHARVVRGAQGLGRLVPDPAGAQDAQHWAELSALPVETALGLDQPLRLTPESLALLLSAGGHGVALTICGCPSDERSAPELSALSAGSGVLEVRSRKKAARYRARREQVFIHLPAPETWPTWNLPEPSLEPTSHSGLDNALLAAAWTCGAWPTQPRDGQATWRWRGDAVEGPAGLTLRASAQEMTDVGLAPPWGAVVLKHGADTRMISVQQATSLLVSDHAQDASTLLYSET